MDLISEENYIIAQAKRAIINDPFTAKAWIITAKTLYPKNFAVQFEAYKIEKGSHNFEEAAKCFSHLILTFQNQPSELWAEIGELTAALRTPETEITQTQDYYVKMFQHLSYDVQHKILLLTENNYEQCKLLLLLLKRFPQAISTHTARILELIAVGMSVEPSKYRDMLEKEALPLMLHYKSVEGFEASHGIQRILTISLEYYIKQIFEEENKLNIQEIWRKIFFLLTICGQILNWQNFLPLEKNWSKDVYWQKLYQLVTSKPTTRPNEQNQIFFYAVTLFIYSLQEYIENIHKKSEEIEINYVLIEGFREWDENQSIRTHDTAIEAPIISVPTSPSCSKETPIAFVTATNCWRLLNSQHSMEFRSFLLKLPLSNWISQFLHDLAVYFGNYEEAKNLMNDLQVTGLQYDIRNLGLNLTEGSITMQYILKILSELPTVPGEVMDNMTEVCKQRHLLLLPLTQRAIIQYCTLTIINNLKRQIFEPNCPDKLLGNLLVLTQLEYPRESKLAEQIFAMINTKRQFTYLLFTSYIIIVDYIEEFMHIWYSNNGEFNLELCTGQQISGTRRIGTRGADKGVKEDFKQIIKQQITKCNHDVANLIAQFIAQEHIDLRIL